MSTTKHRLRSLVLGVQDSHRYLWKHSAGPACSPEEWADEFTFPSAVWPYEDYSLELPHNAEALRQIFKVLAPLLKPPQSLWFLWHRGPQFTYDTFHEVCEA